MSENQHNMNRRQFLGRALLTCTAMAGGASLLSGCGSQGGASSTQASAAGSSSSVRPPPGLSTCFIQVGL